MLKIGGEGQDICRPLAFSIVEFLSGQSRHIELDCLMQLIHLIITVDYDWESLASRVSMAMRLSCSRASISSSIRIVSELRWPAQQRIADIFVIKIYRLTLVFGRLFLRQHVFDQSCQRRYQRQEDTAYGDIEEVWKLTA